MTKKLTKQIGDALNLLSQANDAMINAIIAVVKNSEDGEIDYTETCSCGIDSGYDVCRTIKYNEDGNLCVFDDYDNQIGLVEDLSANELYDICLKIS